MDKNIQLLIEKCYKRDIRAQEKLYKLFYNYGMSIAVRYSHNLDIAGEVYNESFLKVFKRIRIFDPKKSFKSWLRMILINTAIDYYRKEIRHSCHTDITECETIKYSGDVIEKLNAEDIIKILHELPNMNRIVFNLYELEGYKHEEISEMLNITRSTSRSCLSRAKEKLRHIIANNHEI